MFRSSSIYSSLNDKLGANTRASSSTTTINTTTITSSSASSNTSASLSSRKESFLHSLRRKSTRPLSYSVSSNNLNQQYNERLVSRQQQAQKPQYKPYQSSGIITDREEKENMVPARSKTLRTRLSAPNLHASSNPSAKKRQSMYFTPGTNLNLNSSSAVAESVTYEAARELSGDEEWTTPSASTTPMTMESRDTLMDSILQSEEDHITISDEEIPDATGKPTLLSHTKIPKSYDFFRLPRSSQIQNLTMLNPLVTETCLENEKMELEDFNYQCSDDRYGMNVSLVGQSNSALVMTVSTPTVNKKLGWELIYNLDYNDMFREEYAIPVELVF